MRGDEKVGILAQIQHVLMQSQGDLKVDEVIASHRQFPHRTPLEKGNFVLGFD